MGSPPHDLVDLFLAEVPPGIQVPELPQLQPARVLQLFDRRCPLHPNALSKQLVRNPCGPPYLSDVVLVPLLSNR